MTRTMSKAVDVSTLPIFDSERSVPGKGFMLEHIPERKHRKCQAAFRGSSEKNR